MKRKHWIGRVIGCLLAWWMACGPLLAAGQKGVVEADTVAAASSRREIPIVSYRFQPKSLILPASLITVGAIGTAIDGMNDFHLLSRKDSVKQIHVDDYLEWACWAGCSLAICWARRSTTGWISSVWLPWPRA